MRLDDFYDMPYCEFYLKSLAYHRMQKEKMYHTRFIAYHAMIGSHLDPKRIPSIDKLLPIDGDKKKNKPISSEAVALFNLRMQEYNEAVAQANNITT